MPSDFWPTTELCVNAKAAGELGTVWSSRSTKTGYGWWAGQIRRAVEKVPKVPSGCQTFASKRARRNFPRNRIEWNGNAKSNEIPRLSLLPRLIN